MESRTVTEQVLADCQLVTQHVLRDPNCDYAIHAKSHHNARLTLDVADAPLSNLGNLAMVVNWVVMAMFHNAQTRVLTSDEVLVLAAATRVGETVEMLDTLRRCNEALAAKDFDEARVLWATLAPHHTFIVSVSPVAAHFDTLLNDADAVPANPSTH